jgi:transcriptional regulator with XRE-family HTH domain
MVNLSSVELVRLVRGERTQIEFAQALGVAQSMVSDWERGAHTPSSDIWLKMARITKTSLKIFCWQRAGLDRNEIDILHQARAIEAGGHISDDLEKKQTLLRALGVEPEPVTGPFGDEPVGGEPVSLKGPSKDIKEFCDRNRILPPDEPAIGEPKPTVPAKKAKRERRRKK